MLLVELERVRRAGAPYRLLLGFMLGGAAVVMVLLDEGWEMELGAALEVGKA